MNQAALPDPEPEPQPEPQPELEPELAGAMVPFLGVAIAAGMPPAAPDRLKHSLDAEGTRRWSSKHTDRSEWSESGWSKSLT